MLWKTSRTAEMPEVILEAFRVHLRPPRPEDCDAWINLRKENAAELVPLEPRWPKDALSKEHFRLRMERQAKQWLEDKAYAFLIFKNRDNTLIGGININHVCRGAAQYASLGYWLDKDHQKQGLMTESLRRLMRFCFQDIKLHRLHAAVLEHNTRSIDLLERIGFKKEGYAEKYIEINGNWENHILYGLNFEKWSQEKS